MDPGWNHWYHLTLTCYGQWLRGDPRGWRERDHRLHVEGDYKNPPKKSAYSQAIHKQSKRLMNSDPFEFTPEQRRRVCLHLLESVAIQGIEVRSVAVGAKHTHLLAQCPGDNPKIVAGKAKNNVWRRLQGKGLAAETGAGGSPIWAEGCGVRPIRDREHFHRAFWYDLDHRDEGAWVWCYLEPRDCSVICRHTCAPE